MSFLYNRWHWQIRTNLHPVPSCVHQNTYKGHTCRRGEGHTKSQVWVLPSPPPRPRPIPNPTPGAPAQKRHRWPGHRALGIELPAFAGGSPEKKTLGGRLKRGATPKFEGHLPFPFFPGIRIFSGNQKPWESFFSGNHQKPRECFFSGNQTIKNAGETADL